MHDPITGYAGVDWATDTHAICVVNDQGAIVDEGEVANTADGLAELCRRVRRAGAARVAIERPDGPVVDAVLAAGLEVVVVSSRSVKALRERYGTAGNKSDRGDAYVLADCLRTDGHRWRSLEPDSPATVTLRSHVRARKDLVETRVATANQLRAHLRVVFPGAVGLFKSIDSPISLRFLARFPSATSAGWLSDKRLGSWLRANGYSGRRSATELHARLSDAPGGLTGDEGDARGSVTLAYVEILGALRAQIDELDARLAELLDAHPDAHIFRSLPRCATVRAATLLAEIGDCRARFPDAESLCCLAGVAPSTRSSGRHRAVTFRFSSDTKLRNAICDFAGDSWRGNTWAEHRYRELRNAGKSHPHAERILARSWTHIIWRCWQDGVTYDPTRHGAHQRLTAATG
ncbi:MAG TPA: IS110 family transposase [Acidimicrobiales bacterium]|jgi:transposase|nr:IS110 family transposase [Acidimicrobiales bacterium]